MFPWCNEPTNKDPIFLLQVVGEKFDECVQMSKPYYETIYALLDTLSPGYRKSFGEALVRKLSHLQEGGIVELNQESELEKPVE